MLIIINLIITIPVIVIIIIPVTIIVIRILRHWSIFKRIISHNRDHIGF